MITRMRDISSRYIAESAMLFLSSSLPFPHPLHIFFLHFCHKKSPILKYRALTYLSIGFYSDGEVVIKKASIPRGRGFVLKVIFLILFLSDVVCFLEYLAMQKQFRVVCFVYS